MLGSTAGPLMYGKYHLGGWQNSVPGAPGVTAIGVPDPPPTKMQL